MIDYSAVFTNTSGAFPNIVGVNASGPSATDGTEFIKAFIDDLWGARQALMDHAGLTPNAATEAAGASQALQAMQFVSGNPGEIVAWAGDVLIDPSSLGIRIFELTGQGVLRANFLDLDTYTYVGNADNPTASSFYHADDAAGTIRNTAGIYLIMPDLRGYFLRGLDLAAAVDPDGAGRDIGNVQNDAITKHYHNIFDGGTVFYPRSTADGSGTSYTGISDFASGTPAQAGKSDGSSTIVPGGVTDLSTENRPTNIAIRWCIRY